MTAARRLFVAAVALLVIVGACGGSSSDDAAAGDSVDPSDSGASAGPESDSTDTDSTDGDSTDTDTGSTDGDQDDSDTTADEPAGAQSDGDQIVCWSTELVEGDGIAWDRVTEQAGLVEPLTGMHGHATAAGDVDGDGWTDLFVGGFADRETDAYTLRGADGPSPDRLLLGGPDGFTVDDRFEGELARTSGAAFADLDGDGDLDLVVVRNPRHDGEISSRPTTVYENDDGSWRLASTIESAARGRAVAVFDIDRDGLADLVLAADRFGDGPTRLYRNDGGFAFSDASDEWGLPDDMVTLAVAAADLNADGWIDVVVSGDERVLLGGPDGFTVSVQESLRWQLEGDEDDPAGIAVGDLDGDGRPDLVIGHHFNSTIDFDAEVPVRVFLNRTSGDDLQLDDVTSEAGIPGLWTKSPHVAVIDVDNDGLLDIVTSAATSDDVPYVLRNTGIDDSMPRFESIGEPGDGQYWVTGAVDDFDRDGRADIFLVEWEPALESPMFRATGASGAHVRLDVSSLGIDAPGTIVEAWGESGTLLASDWIETSTGYAAGAPAIAHLGLGIDLDDQMVRLVVTPVALEPFEISVPVNSASRLGGC
jgi:hypothetical protein